MKKTTMLKKNYEFKNVLTKGKCYSGKYLEIFVKKNNKNLNRLGLAISTKVGKSVRRNRIKRLIRENYKLIEDQIIDGVDIVFLCKKDKDVENITFFEIKDDIYYIFNKAKIVN